MDVAERCRRTADAEETLNRAPASTPEAPPASATEHALRLCALSIRARTDRREATQPSPASAHAAKAHTLPREAHTLLREAHTLLREAHMRNLEAHTLLGEALSYLGVLHMNSHRSDILRCLTWSTHGPTIHDTYHTEIQDPHNPTFRLPGLNRTPRPTMCHPEQRLKHMQVASGPRNKLKALRDESLMMRPDVSMFVVTWLEHRRLITRMPPSERFQVLNLGNSPLRE